VLKAVDQYRVFARQERVFADETDWPAYGQPESLQLVIETCHTCTVKL
jgi:hypothetical protein